MKEAVPTTQSLTTTPKRSDGFAFLFPHNDDAQRMLKLRANRMRLVHANQCIWASVYRRSCADYVAKMDFAHLLGRQCFSFGASRWNAYKFPPGDGVEDYHFTISVAEKTSAKLIVTDCSHVGIELRHPGTDSFRLLSGRSEELTSGTTIRVGSTRPYEFVVAVTDLSQFSVFFEERERWSSNKMVSDSCGRLHEQQQRKRPHSEVEDSEVRMKKQQTVATAKGSVHPSSAVLGG